VEILGGFAPKVHELAISPDHATAYAPIYGDGRHGNNPNPGHLIAVFDLAQRRHKGDFSVSPFIAPHGLRWGPAGQLYCVCEASGVVAEMDSVTGEIQLGPLANRVADCAKADAVMAGEDFAPLEPLPLAGLRFGIAQGFPLENLEETVAAAVDAATERLAKAGVRLTREPMPLFDEMRQVNAYGGVVQPEAFAIHQDRLKRRAADIDPNIRVRLERGGAVSAADYINMLYVRERLVRAMDRRLSGLDALIMPTAGIVAPKIADMADPDVFAKSNMMLLRNTSVGNFFDLCGISLPLPPKLPVGLMLLARNGMDHTLLRIAAAIEALFAWS
jgi:aspartyl-tRNA(Asn)/glutamyl-tRNA(Gln) amidotransferase subunit A